MAEVPTWQERAIALGHDIHNKRFTKEYEASFKDAEIADLRAHHSLEEKIIKYRAAIIPEYEGGFHAEIYDESDTKLAFGFGSTPAAALNDAIIAHVAAQLKDIQ